MSAKRTHPTREPRLDPGAGLTEKVVVLPDGRRIRAVVAGDADGPLVVLEAGMSAPAACWVHTQRELSRHARTLSYDRAGYGGSDVDTADRTLERLVDDLVDVLDTIGETRPVVLVGHSWGGPILRCFADRHPERTAGLVLVDGTVAELISPAMIRINTLSFRISSLLARLGGSGLVMRMALSHGWSDSISPADRFVLERDYACPRAMRAGRREAAQLASARPLLERLQAAGTPDVPTICLQGGRVDRGTAKLRPLWNRIVEQLMAGAPRGRIVVVEDSGHLIPQEQPAAVHDAVLEVLGEAERG
ncbi:pimeloyl-ACP methyl ester carboxylesterase [Nocardioides sp. J9]|uniref:alpha/beta fold hydrolase n=1 Tax=Nocardioides sp. J9 TaxID=935844 RepID=UPI0011AC2886|nr:alpha/beta hydrolase [Nocardioides sp. J9]TWG99017.1 pimeloyl-ACP methyl ester carboxylesterase [Nocardioides sp. J9]